MTVRQPDPMTLTEHEQLGEELHRIRDRLVHLQVELANRYGKSRRPGGLAGRALAAVDALRSELDDQLARDDPAGFRTTVYYPGPLERPESKPGVWRHPGSCLRPAPGLQRPPRRHPDTGSYASALRGPGAAESIRAKLDELG
jgi:hypothetical protein